MTTTGSSLKTVISTHDTVYFRLGHQFAESRQISIPQVIHGNAGIIGMAVMLRAAMNGIVLGTGHSLQVVRIVTFQAANDCRSHFGRQIRVFPVGFLATSPAGITKNIDVGCPVSQSAINISGLAFPQVFVEKGTAFRRGHVSHLLKGFRIECGSHTDRLGENSYFFFCTSHSMQGFIPPVISRDTQAGNSRGGMFHQLDFLFQSQPGNNILHTYIQR